MNTHKNARLTVHGRALLVTRILEHGLRPEEAAQAMGVSTRTAYKWLTRYREEGMQGLENRTSRPHHHPHAICEEQRQRIIAKRYERRIYRQISSEECVSPSTVARVLRSAGVNRLSSLEPARPSNRYEHDNPGDLLHLDIKKLGRFRKPGHRVTGSPQAGKSYGAGWEYVHMAIDDHSRIAWATICPDESGASAWRALIAALRYYRSLGIRIQRVLTDNGGCYRSGAFARACRRLGLKHRRTKPYTPRTNGKAERWIQTALREWAYACSYDNSAQRAEYLPVWIHQYNWHRPHSAIGYLPPISRLPVMNNLLALHI